MRISATIVALNEERNIRRAIESLLCTNEPCVDEILVVDSGSVDRTPEIAAELGAKVIEQPWRGYAGQKNFAAKSASHDWILSLDADEELTPELAKEILALKQTEPDVAGYSMPRLAQYLGRWIRHSGWYPDRKVRLYHRGRATWVGDYVHESVRVNGEAGRLRGDLRHYTCTSISEHVRTMDKYTSLAAQELLANGVNTSTWKLGLDPAWTFFKSYVIQSGFLDGPQGLAIAWMAAQYTFLKYAKARNWRAK
jgi:glycosyltransferase involved in cell wall biosynthesis